MKTWTHILCWQLDAIGVVFSKLGASQTIQWCAPSGRKAKKRSLNDSLQQQN